MKADSSRIARLLLLSAAMVIAVAQAPAHPPQSQPTSPQTAGDTSAALAERIHRIETNFAPISLGEKEPPLEFDLHKLMDLYHVPGLSVAVIDHYKISWAKAYGVTEMGSTTPVTTRTLFQAGSISKPVAATGALYLVEHGRLSLDEDVNKKLVTWKVPENEFTKDQKVTLRRLMTHSAGLTVHGFPGYAVGEPVPSLVQIFNGEKPANTAPIRVDFVPGSKSLYSGGGITIEQQLVIDVTGRPFPAFMRETVLDKIGMSNSTYEQPLPPARAALAASGTYAGGKVVPGKWHIYPEMAAAGLWTTPTDLAKFAIEIALSKQGKSNRVLSEAMTREMLTPQIENVGLGFFLGDAKAPAQPGQRMFLRDAKALDQFGHNGADEGFQALLVMFADSGQGVAVMANSDNGLTLVSFLVENIAREYGWKSTPAKPSAGDILYLIADVKGAQAALDKYSALRKAAPPADATAAKDPSDDDLNENTLNILGYQLLGSGRTDDAIRVLKRNVQEYPKSWNPYDSLGEAYMRAGQRDLATENYERSIALNPANTNGIEMLKKLKEQK